MDGKRDIMFVAPWCAAGFYSDDKAFEWQVYSVASKHTHVSATDGRLDRVANSRASA
jgi:hypothetical protein